MKEPMMYRAASNDTAHRQSHHYWKLRTEENTASLHYSDSRAIDAHEANDVKDGLGCEWRGGSNG